MDGWLSGLLAGLIATVVMTPVMSGHPGLRWQSSLLHGAILGWLTQVFL